jgi:hypothetical protein
MPGRTIDLPNSGFALEIDGRLKTEFSTKEGAESGDRIEAPFPDAPDTHLRRRHPIKT